MKGKEYKEAVEKTDDPSPLYLDVLVAKKLSWAEAGTSFGKRSKPRTSGGTSRGRAAEGAKERPARKRKIERHSS